MNLGFFVTRFSLDFEVKAEKRSKMSVKSIFFVFLVIFGTFVNTQRTTCTFLVFANLYTCRLINQNVLSVNDMQIIDGVHMQNRNDASVHLIDHTTSTVQVFPNLMLDRFVNVRQLRLTSVGMKSLGPTLTNCQWLSHLDLSRNQLTSLPEGFFQNCNRLLSLTLRQNQISEIHDNAFIGLTQLSTLTLPRNKIRSINQNWLVPMRDRLIILDFDDNEIEEINANILADISRLIWLSLRNNKISSWNAGILQRNPRLERLYLAGNQIRTITAGTFSNLPNLLELSVGGLLQEIPVFENLQRVENLGLHENQLTHVSAASFIHMDNLSQLNLARNQIETFNFAMTTPRILANLRTLELTNNSITNVTEGSLTMLTNLTSLLLGSNQLETLSYESIQPVLPLLSLNVRHNRIVSIDREIFEGDIDMFFSGAGNVCINSDFRVDANFDMNRLERCFNSGTSAKVSIFVLIFATVIFVTGKI